MRRILVVDDNDHNREYMRQVLEESWDVDSASDGEQALRAVEGAISAGAPPALILLDLSMPRLDGWGVLGRLRAEPGSARIPVVACSAHAMTGDRERALAAGFDGYLTKPFRPAELIACVEGFLGAAEARAAGGEASDADAGDDGWGGEDWSLSDSDWGDS